MNALNRDFIINKIKSNRFPINLEERPLIVILRETAKDLSKIPDNGENICDTIVLMDEKNFIVVSGRSFPHKKYQINFMKGGEKCNRIASSYVQKAWVKGLHKGYRALRQNVPFYIWRSKDLIWGNKDDTIERDIVADNFHALAPWSAGCVTVQGYPEQPKKYPGGIRGDWKIVDNYLYNIKKNTQYFDACIFERKDIEINYPIALRIGSSGLDVRNLQKLLKITIDGDFGPKTFEALREWQSKNGFYPDGIAWPEVLEKIGFNKITILWGYSIFEDTLNSVINSIKNRVN